MTAYCSRRTLVIGGFGYIGSHVVAALTQAGADVTVVTPSRERHAGAAARLDASGGRTIEADVRDGEALRTAVAGQDVIVNLSGQSGALRRPVTALTDGLRQTIAASVERCDS